jgi:hypothetical protein
MQRFHQPLVRHVGGSNWQWCFSSARSGAWRAIFSALLNSLRIAWVGRLQRGGSIRGLPPAIRVSPGAGTRQCHSGTRCANPTGVLGGLLCSGSAAPRPSRAQRAPLAQEH